MTQTHKLKAIELFAGIGGFHLGIKAANIDTIWANDLNELCCQIYQSQDLHGRNPVSTVNHCF